MDSEQIISEGLISSRNILLNGRSNDNVLKSLEDVISNINSIAVSSTRDLVDRCVREAVVQIKKSNFVSAGLILNLIHNLPMSQEREREWDIDYFLSMELPSFLEHYDEIQSSRSIVLYVCSQLALKYA